MWGILLGQTQYGNHISPVVNHLEKNSGPSDFEIDKLFWVDFIFELQLYVIKCT